MCHRAVRTGQLSLSHIWLSEDMAHSAFYYTVSIRVPQATTYSHLTQRGRKYIAKTLNMSLKLMQRSEQWREMQHSWILEHSRPHYSSQYVCLSVCQIFIVELFHWLKPQRSQNKQTKKKTTAGLLQDKKVIPTSDSITEKNPHRGTEKQEQYYGSNLHHVTKRYKHLVIGFREETQLQLPSKLVGNPPVRFPFLSSPHTPDIVVYSGLVIRVQMWVENITSVAWY